MTRPSGPRVGSRPSRDFHDDHVAWLARPGAHPEGICDVHDEAAIERDHETEPGPVEVESADDRRGPALQNSNDASFDPAVADTFDTGDHPIAVHGLIQVAAGDEDVALGILERTIGDDETETAWMGRHLADDEVHAVRQPEPVPARLDERAAFYEFRQQLLEGRPLLAGQLEALKHLPRRRRVVQLVANQHAGADRGSTLSRF